MYTFRAVLPLVVLAGFCVQPSAIALAEETKINVQDLVSEFNKDPKLAKEKYTGKQVQMEVTLQKIDFIEDGKKWAMVKGGPSGGKNLKSGLFLHLKNQYRAGDQVVVNATLKTAVWTADSQRLFFDPCTIEKEIEVQPPFFLAEKFLRDYTASPKKMAEKHEGKRVQIKGQVQFRADGGLVLCYLPRRNGKGKIEKDLRGYDLLGRALLTVRFPDDTISKLNPNRGTVIEIEGTVTEMKAGKILITDAKMLK